MITMPLPKPNKGESKEDFVSRFMSSDAMEKEFPNDKKRLGVAHSQFSEGHSSDHGEHKKKKKKQMFKEKSCMIRGIELKSDDSTGEYYALGMIATTHIDPTVTDSMDTTGDKVTKPTLDVWCDQINSENPEVNKASYHHKRERKVVGRGVPEAKVILLPDGEYGLQVPTHINKTWDGKDNLIYEINHGFVDGYSIEFFTNYNSTTHKERINGQDIRIIGPETKLMGWGFASRPVNPNAAITEFGFKELIDQENKEGKPMTEKQENQKKVEAEEKEKIEKEAQETKEKEAAEKRATEIKEAAEKLNAPTPEEMKEYREYKAKTSLEEKEKQVEKSIAIGVKEAIEKLDIKELVLQNKGGDSEELSLEVKEFNEIVKGDEKGKKVEISLKEQFMRAGRVAWTNGMWERKSLLPVQGREYKNFKTNGRLIECKGLGLTTNQNSDVDYLLSSAELRDLFDPVIYNAINQAVLTWNILEKDDKSQQGINQVQFTLKTAANTSAAHYTGNSVTTGVVTRLKYQTKFKKIQVGVSVDGDMIAAARGGPVGDVFAQEVLDSTMDMIAVVNTSLYAEVGLESAAAIIGFEYITDSAGNTSLYSLTRTSANKLQADSASDNYINGNAADISMANQRAAIRHCVIDGSKKNRLVFFTHPVQGDKIRGQWDDVQRRMSSRDSRLGFETDLFIDGVPVFEDKDCNTDDWFLVDLDSHRVAIWVPPTIEALGKSDDSQKAFVKMYYATYSRYPRRMVQIYNNSTS